MSKYSTKSKHHIIYKTSTGLIVPGGSTIANMDEKGGGLVGWAIKLMKDGIDPNKAKEEAGEIGTLTHYRILCDLEGKTPEMGEYSQYIQDKSSKCMESYSKWKSEHKIEPIKLEFPIVFDGNDDIKPFGGTIDFYGKIDGALTLKDFKTSSGLYDSAYIQIMGYWYLLSRVDLMTDYVGLLHLPKTEGDTFTDKNLTDKERKVYWNIFQKYLGIWWDKKELKNG